MDFIDDLVFDEPPIFCGFLEEGFAINIFGFGSHSCFWFYQFWWAELRRGSLLLCSINFYFSQFGWMGRVCALNYHACLLLFSPTLVVA